MLGVRARGRRAARARRIWASARHRRAPRRADHGAIVIDEVAAFLLVLFFVGPSRCAIAFAFVLFRFFDIVKPPPIARDRRGSGTAASASWLDDLVAAGYALLVFAIVVRLHEALGA